MKSKDNYILGILLVIVGSMLLVDRMGFFRYWGFRSLLSSLWPVIFLVLAVLTYMRSDLSGAVFFVLLWVLFQFSVLFGFSVWAMLWPLFIIFAGVSILFKKNRVTSGISSNVIEDDSFEDQAVFQSKELRLNSKDFLDGEVNSVFSSYVLDLSTAEIKEEATLDVSAIFGSVEVIVPKKCKINVQGDSVFGSFENRSESDSSAKISLKIIGSAIFGKITVH